MRLLTETTLPSEFVGAYGQNGRWGVISEHMDLFQRAGGDIRRAYTHAGWAVVEDGRAFPILCSEVIRIETEDGPTSGRCGNFSIAGKGICTAHDFED